IEAGLKQAPDAARSINAEIPARLEEIITKALHKDREQRYQHAADIRGDLQGMERGSDTGWRAAEGAGASSGSHLQPSGQQNTQSSRMQTGTMRAERVSKVINSLAVLPFENASRDAEHEYLSDGIAGSLINILATVPKLRVMAQSTVFR